MLTKNTTAVKVKAGPEDGLAEGEFVVYPSTFTREPDAVNDVVAPGAFLKSLDKWKASGNVLPGLYGHRTDDPDYYVASAIETGEDEHGWWVKGAFDMDSPKGPQVYRLVKGRRLNQLSFAYDVVDQAEVELEAGVKANELRELEVYEFSFVPVGANQDTGVVAVKAIVENVERELKAGRTLSAKNESSLRGAYDSIGAVLDSLDPAEEKRGNPYHDRRGRFSHGVDGGTEIPDQSAPDTGPDTVAGPSESTVHLRRVPPLGAAPTDVPPEHRDRYELGYGAAQGTHNGTLSNPGTNITEQGYGNTSPDNHPDTYYYNRGWNDAVGTVRHDSKVGSESDTPTPGHVFGYHATNEAAAKSILEGGFGPSMSGHPPGPDGKPIENPVWFYPKSGGRGMQQGHDMAFPGEPMAVIRSEFPADKALKVGDPTNPKDDGAFYVVDRKHLKTTKIMPNKGTIVAGKASGNDSSRHTPAPPAGRVADLNPTVATALLEVDLMAMSA